MAQKTKIEITPEKLPQQGKSRWEQLKHFIPVSRETFRKMYLAKKAPQPQRLSLRCTVWDNGEIHRWLANPEGYAVEGQGNV